MVDKETEERSNKTTQERLKSRISEPLGCQKEETLDGQ